MSPLVRLLLAKEPQMWQAGQIEEMAAHYAISM